MNGASSHLADRSFVAHADDASSSTGLTNVTNTTLLESRMQVVCRALDTLAHRHRSSQRHKGVLLDVSHSARSTAQPLKYFWSPKYSEPALEQSRQLTSQFLKPLVKLCTAMDRDLRSGDDRGRSEDPPLTINPSLRHSVNLLITKT